MVSVEAVLRILSMDDTGFVVCDPTKLVVDEILSVNAAEVDVGILSVNVTDVDVEILSVNAAKVDVEILAVNAADVDVELVSGFSEPG